jgi:hypothetical protein
MIEGRSREDIVPTHEILKLITVAFPHLFPDGKGGFVEDRSRPVNKVEWVEHLLHFCELVKDENQGTYHRVRRFAECPDLIFFIMKLFSLQKMTGLAFIAGKRAQERGILNPLSNSAVSVSLVKRAIAAAKQMTPDQFRKSVAGRLDFEQNVVMKFIRQLRPYEATVLNSEADFKSVNRTVKAVLMDPDLMPGNQCCIFFTVAHDDPNHLDTYKMVNAQRFQDDKVTDESFKEKVVESERNSQGQTMSRNPVLSCKYFMMKMHAFVHYIVNGRSKPFGGNVTDMVKKMENQRNGGWHTHFMFFLDIKSYLSRINPGANSLEECLQTPEGKASFERFLDRMISGSIPRSINAASPLDVSSYMGETLVLGKI